MVRTRSGSRSSSFLIVVLGVVAVFAGPAHGQTFPSRPIEFVAHTSAGSGTDLFARNVTELLAKEKIFSQPFLISNRVGGQGVIAYNYIKSKRGDPHVVLTVATGGVLSAASRPDLELPLDIYTPLALFAQDPQVVAVRAESKFKTFKELAEAARREPNTLVAGFTGAMGR